MQFLSDIYNKIFTYKQQYKEHPESFGSFAFYKNRTLLLMSIFPHLLMIGFIGHGIYQIHLCKVRHQGADLFYVEMILFSVMGMLALFFSQTKMLAALFITSVAVTIDQYNDGINHWLLYLILAITTLYSFYIAAHMDSLNKLVQTPES